jgi:hypothetical protein
MPRKEEPTVVPTFLHRQCGTRVIDTSRMVGTQPEDDNWPRDVWLILPYCPACKRLISFVQLQCLTCSTPSAKV